MNTIKILLQKFNKLLMIQIIMQKYYFTTILLIISQCTWIENRINKDQRISTFHKNVIWKEPSYECTSQFFINKIKVINIITKPNILILAENKKCSILFKFIGVDQKYTLSSIVITSDRTTLSIHNKSIPIMIKNNGWGYELLFTIPNEDQVPLRFIIYLTEGLKNDPLLHFY